MKESWNARHFAFDGAEMLVDGCTLEDGRLAMAIVGEQAEIRNSVFDSQQFYGIVAQNGRVQIEDCEFFDQFIALYEYDSGRRIDWAVSRIVVHDVVDSTFRYCSIGTGYIHDSILARGAEYTVKYHFAGSKSKNSDVFDMTNNWWGTTTPDSIRAWIYDGEDDENIGVVVEFVPFKDELVSVQDRSLSDVKALFK